MAGREGIEPSSKVLETSMLPLHYRPIRNCFCFSTSLRFGNRKLYAAKFVLTSAWQALCRLLRPSHIFATTNLWFGRPLLDVLPFDCGGKDTV